MPGSDRPDPRQQVVLHLRRQLHLGVAGGVGELFAVREGVLDQRARLLGDGERQLDVGRAERPARSRRTQRGDAGVARPDRRHDPAIVAGRRRGRGVLADVDLGRLADLVEPAADAARLERRVRRGDDLRRPVGRQQRDEAEVGLEEAPHLGRDRLERQREVELVAAGSGQVVEGEDLVLPVDQLGREEVPIPFAADERGDGRGVGVEPQLGVRLRADEPQLQLVRVGDARL